MSTENAVAIRLQKVLRGGVSKILIGSLIGQGTLLAVSPVLTRLYEPRDFAALTVFTALATVAGGLITLSWERAIVIPRSETQARSVVLLGLLTVSIIGIVLAPVAFLMGPKIDARFRTSVFTSLWWLLPVTVIVMGLYAIMSSWLIRTKHYGKLANRNALQGVTQAVSTVLFGISGVGTFGLVSGMGIGRLVSIAGVLPWSTAFNHRRQSRVRVITAAKRFRRFPLVATWSRVFNILGLQLPPLLIVAFYGVFEAGLYALTVRVLAAPVGIVADAVSQHFEGVFAERVRAKSPTLRSLILRTTTRLFVVSLLPGLVIALFGPSIFAFVFGEEWRTAGTFAQIVVILYLAQFVASPISRTLLVLEKQFTQLVWDITRMVLTVIAVSVPAVVGGSLSLALALFAGTQVILYIVLLRMSLRAARKSELGLDLRHHSRHSYNAKSGDNRA